MSVQIRTRDKFAIGALLASLSLAAWIFTIDQARTMARPMETMTEMAANSAMLQAMGQMLLPVRWVLFLSTWVAMMAAMMLPSAAPMVMTYAAVARQRCSRRPAYVLTGIFVLGYLLAWSSLGLFAYVVSAVLPALAMAYPGLQSHAALFGGAVLILAGVYQFSDLKSICLSHCQTPLGFILRRWREGPGGVLRMGLEHGFYCIGCCWALMAILFVIGVMNLAGMTVLALVVFAEKVSTHGMVLGRVIGILLIIGGITMAAGSLL